MILPTLRAVAASLNRGLAGFTVTELLEGTRAAYLKKTADYSVDPQARLTALLGTGLHAALEGHAYGDISSEVRLYGEYCSGKYDLYGAVLDEDDAVLADIKTVNAAKLSRALGFYKADVPCTGDYFKSGPRKGQQKTKKEWRTDGVHHIIDWAVQLNAYRILLEAEGQPVSRMVVQAIVRDWGARATSEQNLDRAAYIISVPKISDRWISRYLGFKAVMLEMALKHGITPSPCRPRERWSGDRKCLEFCDVADYCDYKPKKEEDHGDKELRDVLAEAPRGSD